ncbi:hypothetical protein NDU88_001077 [Pleurodeles waltl]|uniref:Uncharacterized protein n=1 Tax=Pleurodeles waltl TaxID=8319 RepID=A0AAV7S6C7_PLEWA|nr:hypothetical protein NDU88_001077 [Pleurodeles waltl]
MSEMRKTCDSDVLSKTGGEEIDDGMHVAQLDLVGFRLCALTMLSDPGRTREGTSHVQKHKEKKIKEPRGPGKSGKKATNLPGQSVEAGASRNAGPRRIRGPRRPCRHQWYRIGISDRTHHRASTDFNLGCRR